MRLGLLSFAGVALCGVALATPEAGAPALSIEARVRALYEGGQWAEAARLAARAGTRSADLDYYQGLALARLGKLSAARQAFLEGQRLSPGDARFGLELAGVAYRNHDSAAAKKWLKRSLRLDPSSDCGNDFLASLFLLEGNVPAALKYWNRIGKPLIEEMRFAPALNLEPLFRVRALAVSPGQVFTLDRLRATQANLDRMGILARYRFDLTPRQDQRFDLTLRSVDRAAPVRGWAGAVLPLVSGLPYETVSVDLYNIGRRAIRFHALGRWDSSKRRLALSFGGPVRLNPSWRYRLGLDARAENWDLRSTYFGRRGGLDGVMLRKIEAGAESVYGVNSRLQWTAGLWIARRGFEHADSSPWFADSWSFELQNKLEGLLWSMPERRLRVEASTSLRAGRVLGSAPSRFAVAGGDLRGTWLPLAEGDNLSVAVRARAAKTFGEMPFDDYFLLGMDRDSDLWLRGHVSTRDGRKGSAPLGTQYSLFQSEADRTLVRLPFVSVRVGPFFDAGRIGDPAGQFGSHGWMEDTGVQAKIRAAGGLTWTLVYGRDLRAGRGVFYTAVSR